MRIQLKNKGSNTDPEHVIRLPEHNLERYLFPIIDSDCPENTTKEYEPLLLPLAQGFAEFGLDYMKIRENVKNGGITDKKVLDSIQEASIFYEVLRTQTDKMLQYPLLNEHLDTYITILDESSKVNGDLVKEILEYINDK